MTFKTTHAVTALMLGCAAALATAAVPADEAAQLGKTLNYMGGEMAGNADGTIPPYTGGYRGAPADASGPKRWTDPYAGEKPRLVITSENYAQHQDRLSESTKELFKRYKTFRMDVYPTHRSAWLPQEVIDNTVKNATSGKIAADGVTASGVFGGVPFPIPKSGIEVWWNHELRYKGTVHENNVATYMVDSAGRVSLNGAYDTVPYYAYYDFQVGRDAFLKGDGLYYKVYSDFSAPAGRIGEASLYWTWLDNQKHTAKGWSYTPGTRRVRSTPDLFYDTPCPGYNGGITMDDLLMTYGPQDRVEWKLVGKQEKYVLYNNYTQQFKTPSRQTTTPNHPNPDDMRWELHRVWVIEGKPKPGVRHIYSKRVVYVDEDGLNSQMETYDQAGKLFRAGWTTGIELYDIGVMYAYGNFFFDFSTGTYWMGSHPADPSVKGLMFPKDDSWRKRFLPTFTPEYLQANGIR